VINAWIKVSASSKVREDRRYVQYYKDGKMFLTREEIWEPKYRVESIKTPRLLIDDEGLTWTPSISKDRSILLTVFYYYYLIWGNSGTSNAWCHWYMQWVSQAGMVWWWDKFECHSNEFEIHAYEWCNQVDIDDEQ